MWAAQYFGFNEPNRWMTSGGLGTMGYGLPAAMGVQIAHPDSLVIDISGEGSFMMNMQELSTIAQYKLPVKIFILNNEWLGMVRQWQELIHGGRYSQSYSESLPEIDSSRDTYCKRLTNELDNYFPEVEGDKVIQIGTTIQKYGEKDCFLKHIITLDTCDSIPGAVVEAYQTEEEVLLAWRKFIQKLDPDIP